MIKKSNLRLCSTEEGTEIWTKGIENLSNKVVAENDPNVGRNGPPSI
jgi:hypothetical protein